MTTLRNSPSKPKDKAPSLRVWDAPTRLFHWLLVATIFLAWWTASNGQMDWHIKAGYVALGLVVFRIYWGVVGSSTSRFSTFVRGPRATLSYLRELPKRLASSAPGHNPLGAWSILAMLGILAAQIVLGLFAVDVDGLNSGPLSDRVSFDTGRLCAQVHQTLFWVLLGFIALHILAVLFYLFYKRENLIGPMVHGRRSDIATEPKMASLWKAVIGVILAVAAVYAVANGLKV